VIASLNGTTASGWIDYAALLADAGADALELNLYLMAADLDDTAASVEQRIVEVVRRVVQSTDIPVAVKLSPYFTALPELLLRVEDAGALGVVLFNRFYQPDIDLDALEVSPTLDLSTSADLRLPLRWTAVVRRQLAMSIAVSSGVHSGSDVVKALMVGADVAMTTSALLRHGPDHLRTMLDDLAVWLTERDYESTDELRGSMAQHHVGDPDAYERANYVRVLQWGTRRYR
jgi:dihydroorotate dehydrogenase (fumarate)